MGLFNIWLTEACNLKCTYCYESNKSMKYMQKDTIERTIEFICRKSVGMDSCIINFHGGEPLLAFDNILYFVSEFNKRGVSAVYSLTTNGVLLDEEKIKRFYENKIYLSLSLDGNAEVNDKCRISCDGKGTYEKVAVKIPLIMKYYPELRIRMTVTPETSIHLFDSVKHISQLGGKLIIAVPDLYDNKWTKELINNVEKQVIDLYKEFKDSDTEFLFFEKLENCKKGKCDGGINEFNISIEGKLYPCSFVTGNDDYLIGNVVDDVDEALLSKFSAVYGKSNYTCSGCGREEICTASRCKFVNAMMTGDPLKVHPVICTFEHMINNISRKIKNQV
ncbi:MAG: radical SAM protein [Ruminococcus sp.]|nr:radical SAM protein [Ruminococcus sp.]